MRWKLLIRGENSSGRLVLLRTAPFFNVGLRDTQTRTSLTKRKFKAFVDVDRVGQASRNLMLHRALTRQNVGAILAQEADSLSMKGMIGGYLVHNMKRKKEVTGASEVRGGLSDTS